MDIEYYIGQMEEALEKQRQIPVRKTPSVMYCFDCDEICIDGELWDHKEHNTVTSDGYEHHGIGAAITTLEALKESENNDKD